MNGKEEEEERKIDGSSG